MAEEKKQTPDSKDGGGAKKKGLPSIVLIAVGAILGGAGVVFAIPPKTVEVPVAEPVFADIDVTHPDVIKKEFNPRTQAGKGIARFSFKFVYTVREDREHEAYEAIKANWEQANSNVLLILKQRTLQELNTENGIRQLEHDLLADLDRTLFPGEGSSKQAKVTRLFWIEQLVQ